MPPAGVPHNGSFFAAILTGPRLTLRPYWEERDLENIVAMFAELKAIGPLPYSRVTERIGQLKRQRLENPDSGDWTVFLPRGETTHCRAPLRDGLGATHCRAPLRDGLGATHCRAPLRDGDLPDEDEVFVGEVGIADWDPETHVVEIFVAIYPDYAGKAYGREAVSVLMEHICRRSQLATVRVQVISTNEKALKLVESLGFRETGRRFVPPDPVTGFPGANAITLDCRGYQFNAFGSGNSD